MRASDTYATSHYFQELEARGSLLFFWKSSCLPMEATLIWCAVNGVSSLQSLCAGLGMPRDCRLSF